MTISNTDTPKTNLRWKIQTQIECMVTIDIHLMANTNILHIANTDTSKLANTDIYSLKHIDTDKLKWPTQNISNGKHLKWRTDTSIGEQRHNFKWQTTEMVNRHISKGQHRHTSNGK